MIAFDVFATALVASVVTALRITESIASVSAVCDTVFVNTVVTSATAVLPDPFLRRLLLEPPSVNTTVIDTRTIPLVDASNSRPARKTDFTSFAAAI